MWSRVNGVGVMRPRVPHQIVAVSKPKEEEEPEPKAKRTALELKRQEYKTFAQEYVKPVVETAKTAPPPPPYKPFVPSSIRYPITPPPYVYREIEKAAEQIAELPTARMREAAGQPDPRVGSLYFISGIVKAGEAYVKPEIPTAAVAGLQYAVQRPKPMFPTLAGVRPTAPLTAYAETLPPGYRGHAQLFGELVGEYLLGRYVIGPALERGYQKAKQVGTTIKQKVLGVTPIETGWQKTVFGAKGWQYETVKGVPGRPQFPVSHPYIQQEGMEEFLTQTARATSQPVKVRIPKETPWRVLIKHPPTQSGGGLTETILRREIMDVPRQALRGISRKTLLAPYWITAYAPTVPSIFPFLGAGLGAFAKSVKAKTISKPKIPTAVTLETVPSAFLPTVQELIPETKLMEISFQKVEPVQAVKTAQIQKQVQKQMQAHVPPTPKLLQRYPRIFEAPKKRRRKRKMKRQPSLYGRYKRFYPVATPKQVLEMLIG